MFKSLTLKNITKIYLFALLTTHSSVVIAQSCTDYFKNKNQIQLTDLENLVLSPPTIIKPATPFWTPGYTPQESNGQLKFHLTQGRNIFEQSLNLVGNTFFQFVVRMIGAHQVYPKVKKFLADKSSEPYFTRMARAFGMTLEFNEDQLKNIPESGPVIVVANHPLSGIDGIALGALIEKVRPDAKVVLTSLLQDFSTIAESSIFINPFGTKKARDFNSQQRILMEKHLANGGAVILFPSGEVSVKDSSTFAMDPKWKKGVAHLLEKTPEAQIIPIFIDAEPSNSVLKIKKKLPTLSTVAIFKDLTTRLSEKVVLTIGKPISGQALRANRSFDEQMNYLRSRLYSHKDMSPNKPSQSRTLEPIASEMDIATLIPEIEKAKVYYDQNPENPNKGFKVIIGTAQELPNTLLEIGRLREITFRSVGEGSGLARDLDEYDQNYLHVVVVKKETNQIAGAYRIGLIDQLVQKNGLEGLYTYQFFKTQKILPDIQDGIELGRSFVTIEFQRSAALLVLFRGISQFIVQNPKYKNLIGSVSISNDFKETSKALMVEWLKQNHIHPKSHLVTATTIPQFKTLLNASEISELVRGKDLRELEDLIQSIEGRKVNIPPLIGIYLSLGVKVLTFDHDTSFNTIDGLIWTDLSQQPYDILKKYMSDEGAAQFLNLK